jgi:hypothetical protein
LNTQKSKTKIVIKVDDHGIMVYDDITKDKIDLFPNSDDGRIKALKLVLDLMVD